MLKHLRSLGRKKNKIETKDIANEKLATEDGNPDTEVVKSRPRPPRRIILVDTAKMQQRVQKVSYVAGCKV